MVDQLEVLREKVDSWPDGANDVLKMGNWRIIANFAAVCAAEACLDQQNPDIYEEACWETIKSFAGDLWHDNQKPLARELLRTQLGITPREAGLR